MKEFNICYCPTDYNTCRSKYNVIEKKPNDHYLTVKLSHDVANIFPIHQLPDYILFTRVRESQGVIIMHAIGSYCLNKVNFEEVHKGVLKAFKFKDAVKMFHSFLFISLHRE